MSRSYRKPVYRDGGHWTKKKHSRAYRRMVKQRCHHWLTNQEDELEFTHPYTITNPYDFCDHWWYAPDEPEAYRK
jgi:hypothetical protein